MLLSEMLEASIRDYSDNVAIYFRDEIVTYRELGIAVNRFAAGMYALGVCTGDKVSLLLPNCTPFFYGYYGTLKLGAVVVPVNPMLKAAELEYIWRDSDVSTVVTIPQLLPAVLEARKNLPNLKRIVCAAKMEDITDEVLYKQPGFTLLPEVMGLGAKNILENPNHLPDLSLVDEKECAVIIYTSGTTGHPKGAMLSHKNLTTNVAQVQDFLQFTPEDRFLTILPLFHAFAGTVCLNVSMSRGCSSILLEMFTPAKMLEAIVKLRPSIFPAVPAIFNALLLSTQNNPIDMSSIRLFVSGGAPLPEVTLKQLESRFGIPVLEGDGPTECSPCTSVNPLHGVRKVGSVGLPLKGVEIAIFDDNDNPVPTDELGEIVVRGDNVMLGYLNQPEATAEAMRSGWYHTGDIGKIDSDGYVYILDRKKDMVITSGLNVYPREVEEVLLTHPAIADAAVIGLPDSLRGEEVVAVLIKKPEAEVTEREVLAFARDRIASYKQPRRVIFRDTLPRGGTGKVLKRLLKKELEME